MKKLYWVLWGLCITVFTHAQGSLKTFDAFFVDGMQRIDGIFPVYVTGDEVYLEIPQKYIGREVEIRGQIDKGFDLIGRPAGGWGVVRILSPDESTVCFQQPFYTERMLEEKSSYALPFSLSNVQPSGVAYPVVAYSAEGGAILRITESLLTGDDWFGYEYGFVRAMIPDLSKVVGIHPFEEGVSFTIRRYHEAEAGENNYSSSSVMLPPGSMPLEVTCVFRLLPQKKDRIRLANHSIPYQTLRFKDYSQNPYSLVEDSLILRWDLSNPILFYVDTLFPKEYFQAVKRGVLAWNEAFQKAGIRRPLQVKYMDKQSVSAEQKALISYDLKEPGVTSALTCHPRTGEILSCRIHVGHGFLQEMLEDYVLRYGAVDNRVGEERSREEIAKELMQGEITRVTGYVLGLKDNGFKNWTEELPFKIREKEEWAIYFGYHSFSGSRTCYEDREKLREWVGSLPSPDSGDLAVITGDLSCLQATLSRLDKMVYKKDRRDKEQVLVKLYWKAFRLYGLYLSEMVERIGSHTCPAGEQREAMCRLDTYLFHPVEPMDCPYVKENMLVAKGKVFYPELRKLFRNLLDPKRISVLSLQVWKSKEGYDDRAFFQDLYKGLFNGFSLSAPVSRQQMDYQVIGVSEWIDILQKSRESNIGMERLKDELRVVCDKLSELCAAHAQEEVRDVCTLLTGRIRRFFQE